MKSAVGTRNVTEEHRAESRRLLSIWNRKKAALAERGWATQEKFGHQFGIGNQSAVAAFLNGRTALSLKAAVAFARGLDCKVADFSPRLADFLNEAPHLDRSEPPPALPAASVATISGSALMRELARRLDAIPRGLRSSTADELAVLARSPKDPDALRTLVGMLDKAMPPAKRQVMPSDVDPSVTLAHQMIDDSLPNISSPLVIAQVLVQLDFLLMTAIKRPQRLSASLPQTTLPKRRATSASDTSAKPPAGPKKHPA